MKHLKSQAHLLTKTCCFILFSCLFLACGPASFTNVEELGPEGGSSDDNFGKKIIPPGPGDEAPPGMQALPDSIATLFPASVTKDGSFFFKLKARTVKTDFILENLIQETEIRLTQTSCSRMTQSFTQGGLSYHGSVTPRFDSVELTQLPVLQTMEVRINNVILPSSGYSVTGKILRFSQRPPDRASIRVSFNVVNFGQFAFYDLANTPLSGSIALTFNGQAAAFTFDPATKRLNFGAVPPEGTLISIKYRFVSGPKLSYELVTMAGGFDFMLVDANKKVIPVRREANSNIFTIDKLSGQQAGDKLTLSYSLADSTPVEFVLAHIPLANSVSLKTSDSTCNLGSGLVLKDNKLLSNCITKMDTDFHLSYKFREVQKNFETSGIADPEKCNWNVYINDVETSAYVRLGNRFELTTLPDLEAKISIVCTLKAS